MTLNIFEDVSANVLKGLHIVKKAGSNILEYGLLQGDKARLSEQRKELLCQLGTLLYDMMLKDSLELETLQQKCEQIMEIDEQICAVEQEEEKVAPEFSAHSEINLREHGAPIAQSAQPQEPNQTAPSKQESDSDSDEEAAAYEASDID